MQVLIEKKLNNSQIKITIIIKYFIIINKINYSIINHNRIQIKEYHYQMGIKIKSIKIKIWITKSIWIKINQTNL